MALDLGNWWPNKRWAVMMKLIVKKERWGEMGGVKMEIEHRNGGN